MKKKILIVDDMELNREILAEIMQNEYDILEADDGDRAIQIIREKSSEIAAILLDLIMPGIDGFGVLDALRAMDLGEKIPVLIISGEDSVNVEKKCFDLGISDFIKKPFDGALVKRRTRNITELFAYKNRLEEKVEQQTRALKNQYDMLCVQAEQLKQTNTKIIEVLATIVESRNLESGEHVMRVKGYTKILASILMKEYPEYGLNEEMVEMIGEASALHDVGKIAIPDNILMKPGKLTAEEFECMKSHTTKGGEILKNITGIWTDDYEKLSYEICRHHHEKYDGRGYPDGLKGEEIPISAQLVSVADVYDALVNERCYKSAFTPEKAFEMITGGECGVFSPKIMHCFRLGREQFEALVEQSA